MRVGYRYNVYRLMPDRSLIIGGVRIPYGRGLLGHSDADVLSHAVTDSLLGATVLGGLDAWFPDTGLEWVGVDSLKLLCHVCELMGEKGYQIKDIDATVVVQAPKLRPYIAQMRECLALACDIKTGAVSIKATTEKHLDFTGKEQGVAVHVVCLLRQKNRLLTHLPIAYSVNKSREVMYVGKPVIPLGSITYTMKSRDTLFHYGIKSHVERTPCMQDRLGRGYGVYIPDRADQAGNISIHSGIHVLGGSEGADAI